MIFLDIQMDVPWRLATQFPSISFNFQFCLCSCKPSHWIIAPLRTCLLGSSGEDQRRQLETQESLEIQESNRMITIIYHMISGWHHALLSLLCVSEGLCAALPLDVVLSHHRYSCLLAGRGGLGLDAFAQQLASERNRGRGGRGRILLCYVLGGSQQDVDE